MSNATGDEGAARPARPADGALFCFGYGYCAEALGRDLLDQGWRVCGTTRSEERRAHLEKTGIVALLDDDVKGIAAALETAECVLVSSPPSEEGDPTLRRHQQALRHVADQLSWIGYLSTTAVYGDRGGDWVDETSERRPSSARGKWRVAAEDAWAAFGDDISVPTRLFRLAGIYGPGRGPFAKLRAGSARRIMKPGQVFSRIHVDDIASTIEASMDRPQGDAAYNVCDDAPAPPAEVMEYAAAMLGMPPPPEEPFETAKETMSPMAASFYSESKRVSNKRIKEALGVELAYPTYKEGLAAVLAEEVAGERLGL